MPTTQHAPTAPRQRLMWIKLDSSRVFWPACVYDEYDAATTHNHDLSDTRANKPTPDVDDRLIFFFGVRHAISSAGIAAQATIVPTLRFCVVPEEEFKAHVWDSADDFGNVCRTHHIDDETIARAEQNSAFVRACSDATRFYDEAHSDEDAARLFMAFLTARKTRSNTQQPHSTVTVSRPLTSTLVNVTPVEETRKEKKVEIKAPAAKVLNQAETTAESPRESKLPKELTALCWPLMEDSGWTTFVKPDGGKIYAMPGVQFFQFRPNETVFDALDDACLKYLQHWAQHAISADDNSNQLEDCFLDMMAASGWQMITSADQVVYVMPNTPFDRFIPNETIFQSKQTAISKFLVGLGVGDQQGQPDQDIGSEADDSDATSSSGDESQYETSELDEGSSFDVEMSDADEDVVELKPAEDDRKALSKPAARALQLTSEKKKPSVKPPPTKEVRRAIAPVVPPFKLRQGHVEAEIRSRGWFWEAVPMRKSSDGYMFYKPHCEDKDDEELQVGKDCFAGYLALEDYLKSFEPEVIDKLRQDHENAYTGATDNAKEIKKVVRKRPLPTQKPPAVDVVMVSDDEADANADATISRKLTSNSAARRKPAPDQEEKAKDQATKKPKKVAQKRPLPMEKTPSAAAVVSTDGEADTGSHGTISRKSTSSGAARRKPARDQIKRYQTPRLSVQDIKFGDVWAVLAEKGWFYRPGQFEYDYVKPTAGAKKKVDMVRGYDYFSSRAELEDYLKDSGLWDEIANEIRREVEEDEDLDEVHVTPVKRKQSETESVDSARTPAKKAKFNTSETVDFFTPPPTERVKKSSVSTNHGDIEATQDLTKLMDSSSHISPESTASKSRNEEVTPEGSQLARNLNRVFTPSPTAEKVTKPQESKARPLSALELAEQSITSLSLAHQPSTFAHRETETKKIEEFCRGCFTEQRGGSLYLSGSPGCGKSALLRFLSNQIGQLHEEYGMEANSIVPVHVNAMGIKDFNQVYRQVAETLTNREFTDGNAAFEAIERGTKTALKRSKTLFLILDEIDALGKTNLESELCRLFELAHRPGNSFILVGVANQIDFTERHLASLRLQLPNIKPQVIVFKPYSFQTINDILVDRLGGAASAAHIVNAHGLSFIARKVAAQSGDVRLALDICRRVLQQKLGELAANGVKDFGSPISLIDIVKIIKVVLEGKSKSNVLSLPRNLQMILFATTRLVAQANYVVSTSSSSPTDDSSTTHKLYRVDDLYECYCDVSHDAGVFKPLTRGEFKLGLETLSSEGMIGANELKKQLLKLLSTPSELLQTFKNDAYFARLL